MNLNELAELACSKCRKTDADSVAACKSYLRARAEFLWQEALWKESLIQLAVSVTPDTDALHALGQVMLPSVAGQVLAVRTFDWELAPSSRESWWRANPFQFEETGTPASYTLLGPVVHAQATAFVLGVHAASSSDATAEVHLRYLDANSAEQEDDYTPYTFGGSQVPGVSPPGAVVVELLELTKPVTVGAVSFATTTSVPYTAFLTLSASQTVAPLRQRIQLVPKPTNALTLKVLAKRALQPWTNDASPPPLPGAEHVLVAFAKGDLWERARQMGQAQTAWGEAMGLLERYKATESWQQAARPRLVPIVENPPDIMYVPQKGYW